MTKLYLRQSISIFMLVLLANSYHCDAKSLLKNLTTDGNKMYFSTLKQENKNPPCVFGQSQGIWGVDLTTRAGMSQYQLLISALNDNKSIQVTSAQDCSAVAGFERPFSITIIL